MSENPVRRKFSRHIDIRRYFIRELVKAGIVRIIPLHTDKMVADALTKSLPSPAFVAHRKVMRGHVPFALKFLGSCRDYDSVAVVRGFKFVHTYRSLFFSSIRMIFFVKSFFF